MSLRDPLRASLCCCGARSLVPSINYLHTCMQYPLADLLGSVDSRRSGLISLTPVRPC
jgi:hypothetical protein